MNQITPNGLFKWKNTFNYITIYSLNQINLHCLIIDYNGWDGISFCTGANTRNERMRIASNGFLGVGLAGTAGAKLHVGSGSTSTGVVFQKYVIPFLLMTKHFKIKH